MSDDYLPLLLANMQQTIVDLRNRVQALEGQVATLTSGSLLTEFQPLADEDDEEAAQTYMDGTPVL